MNGVGFSQAVLLGLGSVGFKGGGPFISSYSYSYASSPSYSSSPASGCSVASSSSP